MLKCSATCSKYDNLAPYLKTFSLTEWNLREPSSHYHNTIGYKPREAGRLQVKVMLKTYKKVNVKPCPLGLFQLFFPSRFTSKTLLLSKIWHVERKNNEEEERESLRSTGKLLEMTFKLWLGAAFVSKSQIICWFCN